MRASWLPAIFCLGRVKGRPFLGRRHWAYQVDDTAFHVSAAFLHPLVPVVDGLGRFLALGRVIREDLCWAPVCRFGLVPFQASAGVCEADA
jgi:hypothetical protein